MLINMPAQLNWQSTRLVSGRLSVRFRRLAPLKNPNLRNFLPGVVVQQARTPACHAGGHGFEPRPSRHLKRCFLLWSHRLVVRTGDFQSSNQGPIPYGTAKKFNFNFSHMGDQLSWLEHLPYKQGVIGSSPISPTI